MADTFTDYYELLSVRPDAQPLAIRAAFVQLAKQHHPDVGGSTEYMQQLTTAYRTLASPGRRKAYDLMHQFHFGAQAQYHEYGGKADALSIDQLSDDEIDSFLDSIYAEYHTQAQVKKSWLDKLKQRL